MREIDRQIEIIKKNTVEIIEESELREKIKNSIEKNIPLKVKYGIDPTAPEIHLGHTVPIKKKVNSKKSLPRILKQRKHSLDVCS